MKKRHQSRTTRKKHNIKTRDAPQKQITSKSRDEPKKHSIVTNEQSTLFTQLVIAALNSDSSTGPPNDSIETMTNPLQAAENRSELQSTNSSNEEAEQHVQHTAEDNNKLASYGPSSLIEKNNQIKELESRIKEALERLDWGVALLHLTLAISHFVAGDWAKGAAAMASMISTVASILRRNSNKFIRFIERLWKRNTPK